MARNTKTVTITKTNRDQGKSFYITELPPRQSEKWAARVLFAIAKSGGDDRAREEIAASGMAGLAAVGLRSLTNISFDDASELLDEMLVCVQFIPDLSKVDQGTGKPYMRPVNWDNDVEEVGTIFDLRSEVIDVHMGFSVAGILSDWGAAMKAKSNGLTTQTSAGPSE